MIRPSLPRFALLSLTLALLLGLAASPGLANTKKKGKKPAAASHGKIPKILPSSQETTKERSARLKRECKGRVNAGACEGYTE
jgi:hypothetical protein